MEIKVIQKIDKNYYHEFYAEWLKFRSKFKKWEDKIGMLSISIGILIYFVNDWLKFVSIGLIVFGSLMIYEFHSSKRKWMNSRLNSKMNNKSVIMTFKEDHIQSNGPFTEFTGKWEFIKDVIETEKGIFLIPKTGISIYLQKTSFENPSDLKKIIKKVKGN